MNIGRVLKFTFSDTDTSTFTGPVGETKLFQGDLSDYKLVNGYLNGHLFSEKYVKSASCDLDSSGMAVDISFAGLKIPSGAYTITLNDTTTLSVTLTLDESGESTGTVKRSIGELEDDLQENMFYSVTSVTSQDEPNTLIAPGGNFTVPEGARLSDVACNEIANTEQTKLLISFNSEHLEPTKKYTLTLKRTDTSDDLITREVTTDENGVLPSIEETLYPFKTSTTERKQQLKYSAHYAPISLIAVGRTRSVLITPVELIVPDEPERFVSVTKGKDVVGRETTTFELTFTTRALFPSTAYTLTFTSTSEGGSPTHTKTLTITTDASGSLPKHTATVSPIAEGPARDAQFEFETQYTLTSIQRATTQIYLDFPQTPFRAPAEYVGPVLTYCSSEGSDDVETCGQYEIACSSLLVGWQAGQVQQVSEDGRITLKVEKEVSVGGMLTIGGSSLTIEGGVTRKGKVRVEEKTTWEEGGRVEVNGGSVTLTELVVVLPLRSVSTTPSSPSSFLTGSGDIELNGIVLTQDSAGKIGMGLLALTAGSASFSDVKIEDLSFAVSVSCVNMTSGNEFVRLTTEAVSIRRTTTLNAPLFVLSSSSADSTFELSDMQVLNTKREETNKTGTGSSGSFLTRSIISVATAQLKTTLKSCVFDASKTVSSTDHTELDGVISFILSNPSSSSLRIESCLFIDCANSLSSGRAALVIVSTQPIVRVAFLSTWFEETSVTGLSFARIDGVPILDEKRKVKYGNESTRVGAVIVRSKSMPIVSRSSTRFSGCVLKVMEASTTMM
ncbi:hypothetical protein BLNAU_14266 [Blattamonas nauphoetae]|uniref:Uncharacterized protein n=1 Tax=Blattamonas nauphoetae TaxID=2049346 RepID=A0ABQ9XEE8_9EUKA|nr:hypothetical protein BLNAU_14266 [Blattamonas nauphoetae]